MTIRSVVVGIFFHLILSLSWIIQRAESLQVFDNVLSRSALEMVHEFALQSGLSHKLLHRNSTATLDGRNPLEYTLASILDELGDSSPFIEYWCRQEWRHIEAHADVDEFLAKRSSKDGLTHSFRYPKHAHVLYLQLGKCVRGPTCIFEDCISGGDLASRPTVSLVSVPAVEGRLLRFSGNLLHAVPRPTDLWLRPFVQGSADFNPTLYQRSVVLFNTWPVQPPLNVGPREESWRFEKAESSFKVTPRDGWKCVSIKDSEAESAFRTSQDAPHAPKRAKIWLLGDGVRRNHTMRTVHLFSHVEESLRESLDHPSQPYRSMLHSISTP